MIQCKQHRRRGAATCKQRRQRVGSCVGVRQTQGFRRQSGLISRQSSGRGSFVRETGRWRARAAAALAAAACLLEITLLPAVAVFAVTIEYCWPYIIVHGSVRELMWWRSPRTAAWGGGRRAPGRAAAVTFLQPGQSVSSGARSAATKR